MPITFPYTLTDGTVADADHVMADFDAVSDAVDLKADMASPAFTGTATFGGDANLYRSAANVLKTDDSFQVGVDLVVGGDLTVGDDAVITGDLTVNATLILAAASSFVIGGDTNLYRTGANSLKTDDAFTALGNIRSEGTVSSAGLMTAGNGSVPGHVGAGVKFIDGRVNGDGTVAAGGGFTVSKDGTGAYTVTLTTPLSAAPRSVQVAGASTVGWQVVAHTIAAGSFKVGVQNAIGAAADAPFSFLVSGDA